MNQTTLLLFILSRFFRSQFWPIRPVWFSLWAEASTTQMSILGPPGLNCTPTTTTKRCIWTDTSIIRYWPNGRKHKSHQGTSNDAVSTPIS
jgi:hypothetical protein